MKEKYKIGLHGELINESSIKSIFENNGGGFNVEKAKASLKSTPSASKTSTAAKPASTAAKTELDAYKAIIAKGNFRALEYVINQTVFESLMFVFGTNGIADTKDVWEKYKTKYFKDLTVDNTKDNTLGLSRPLPKDHPFYATAGWTWWFDETKKNLLGPGADTKTNVDAQNGWFFDNIWGPILMSLEKIHFYRVRKDDKTIIAIFNNIYQQVDKLMNEWYNVDSNYKIEFPYVTGQLKKVPDETASYFEQATATKSTVKYKEFTDVTLIEQIQQLKGKGLQGIFDVGDTKSWKQKLTEVTFTCSVDLGRYGVSTTIDLSRPRKLR